MIRVVALKHKSGLRASVAGCFTKLRFSPVNCLRGYADFLNGKTATSEQKRRNRSRVRTTFGKTVQKMMVTRGVSKIDGNC
jgi:hypothetical protein